MPFRLFDPHRDVAITRRRLPHWEQDGVTYFVTWRLADSLPHDQLAEWREARRGWLEARGLASAEEVERLSDEERHQFRATFSEKIEEWLDAGYGSRALANPAAAAEVESALRFFDGDRYVLGEFVVMPTHVHVLVTPEPGRPLGAILQSWKTFTAKAVNAVFGKTGRLWMDENFDHIVRSEEQLAHFERYIRDNPVKAALPVEEYRIGVGKVRLTFSQPERAPMQSARSAAGRAGGLQVHLTLLKLRHFRCFADREVEFAPGFNFIVGPNARGKTSLLEAACILLRLASPRVQRLAPVIQHGRRGFVVDGYFAARHLQFYYSAGRKKLALDSVEQKSAEEYLRIARVMWFSNADIEIARGASEVRRHFLDFLATQIDPSYRTTLRDYERALRSRNLLLKSPTARWREIAAFDAPLLAAGVTIAAARRRLVSELQPEANAAHSTVSNTREALRLKYVPGGGENFSAALKAAEREDARLRQTTVGPHRDELAFFLNEIPAADFASEGQQRTLVFALRLGAARLLERKHGEPPVLLLDDIFGELDLDRRGALLAALPAGAQKLITATHLGWVPAGLGERVVALGEGSAKAQEPNSK